MSTIPGQLRDAADWAASEPHYKVTVKRLLWLADRVEAGDLDLSRLAVPSETEGAWSGLVARLMAIGIDVWAMCPRVEEAA